MYLRDLTVRVESFLMDQTPPPLSSFSEPQARYSLGEFLQASA